MYTYVYIYVLVNTTNNHVNRNKSRFPLEGEIPLVIQRLGAGNHILEEDDGAPEVTLFALQHVTWGALFLNFGLRSDTEQLLPGRPDLSIIGTVGCVISLACKNNPDSMTPFGT